MAGKKAILYNEKSERRNISEIVRGERLACVSKKKKTLPALCYGYYYFILVHTISLRDTNTIYTYIDNVLIAWNCPRGDSPFIFRRYCVPGCFPKNKQKNPAKNIEENVGAPFSVRLKGREGESLYRSTAERREERGGTQTGENGRPSSHSFAL